MSGSVETLSLDGDLSFTTVSGDLTVVGGRTGNLKARTVSGTVTLDVDPAADASISLDSVSGDIAVRLPAEPSLEVSLTSTSGDLRSSHDGLQLTRRPGRMTLTGQLGTGGGRLRGRTVSGDIAPPLRSTRMTVTPPASVCSGSDCVLTSGGRLMTPVFSHGRLRLYLLHLLHEQPRHGYELIRLLEDRFLGTYAPSAGTIYPRLARLEAEGLVTHDLDAGRKVFRLTEAGEEELASRAHELDEVEDDIAQSVRDRARDVREDVHPQRSRSARGTARRCPRAAP